METSTSSAGLLVALRGICYFKRGHLSVCPESPSVVICNTQSVVLNKRNGTTLNVRGFDGQLDPQKST